MSYATEAEFLAHYDIHAFPVPLATVDLCIFTLHDQRLKVLCVQRRDHPCKGRWALPGGFIDIARDADLAQTARRKLTEKTGVHSPYLEQLATIGNSRRDPRGWALTVVYFALIPYVELMADDGREPRCWLDVDNAAGLDLAFDHRELLELALARLRSKVLYTLMPAHLIPAPFTLTGLQQAYEIILGRPVEKKAFRRRLDTAGVLQPTGESTREGAGRPAALFDLKADVREQGFNFSRQLSGDGLA